MASLVSTATHKLIKINGKIIYYHNYVKAQIISCNQMLFDKNNLESYNNAKCKGLIHTNFLTCSRIQSAVPVHLKTLNVEESEISMWGKIL